MTVEECRDVYVVQAKLLVICDSMISARSGGYEHR